MIKGKKYTSRFSSLIVLPHTIVGTFVISLLANWAEQTVLAVFLFTIFIVGLVARLWGYYALRGINVTMSCDTQTMTVGDKTELKYTVENNKLLPLMWLELCLDAPKNGCVSPDSGFSLHVCLEAEEEDNVAGSKIFRRRILFLMGLQSVSWDTVWSARRRGVYEVSKMSLRSGDGFGMSQSMQEINTGEHYFVVWPKIVPVDTAPFFRNVWLGGLGRKGHIEDPTVMQGQRDYAPGDPWKRINWRVAARTDELMVRIFETVLPSTVHFVLDVASFMGLSEDDNELEECLSVLASLILELGVAGINCGLSLPRGKGLPTVDLFPDDPAIETRDLLNSLAALSAPEAVGGFDDDLIESLAQTVGQLWLITFSGARLSCPGLVEKLESACFFTLCSDTWDQGYLAGRPMLSLDAIKRESRLVI